MAHGCSGEVAGEKSGWGSGGGDRSRYQPCLGPLSEGHGRRCDQSFPTGQVPVNRTPGLPLTSSTHATLCTRTGCYLCRLLEVAMHTRHGLEQRTMEQGNKNIKIFRVLSCMWILWTRPSAALKSLSFRAHMAHIRRNGAPGQQNLRLSPLSNRLSNQARYPIDRPFSLTSNEK